MSKSINDCTHLTKEDTKSFFKAMGLKPLEDGPPVTIIVDYKEKYFELLYSVETKYPSESRHQTALRYIRRGEARVNVKAGCDINR